MTPEQALVKPLVWFERPDGQESRIGRCGNIAYGVKFSRGHWGYTRQGQSGLTVSYLGGEIFKDEADAMRGAEIDHAARILDVLDLPAYEAAVRAKALREVVAWHKQQAEAAMGALHCGSENGEYQAAGRLHAHHTKSADHFLALIGPEGGA